MRVEPAVSEAAAEMTVYLCSFVDGQSKPNAEQRVRLEHLVAELQRTLAAAADVWPAAAEPAAARVFRVHRVVPGDAAPDSSGEPRDDRLSVLTLAGVEAAREALAAEQPDAVLIDAALLKALPQLSEAARQHSAGGWRRVLWVAAGIGDDLRLRLYSRRAGIDLVLDTKDPRETADALLSALLRRREESYRILIVEDDRSQIAFSSALLRHQGFEVDVAESSAEALQRVRERVPDLVLLDIHLPDMTGVELAQLLREQTSLAHVPLVFLTGEEDVDVRAEAIAAGGDDFISKPVRPRHLIANVNSRIGRARARCAS
jgi:CheY-like chemotaxis protein